MAEPALTRRDDVAVRHRGPARLRHGVPRDRIQPVGRGRFAVSTLRDEPRR